MKSLSTTAERRLHEVLHGNRVPERDLKSVEKVRTCRDARDADNVRKRHQVVCYRQERYDALVTRRLYHKQRAQQRGNLNLRLGTQSVDAVSKFVLADLVALTRPGNIRPGVCCAPTGRTGGLAARSHKL